MVNQKIAEVGRRGRGRFYPSSRRRWPRNSRRKTCGRAFKAVVAWHRYFPVLPAPPHHYCAERTLSPIRIVEKHNGSLSETNVCLGTFIVRSPPSLHRPAKFVATPPPSRLETTQMSHGAGSVWGVRAAGAVVRFDAGGVRGGEAGHLGGVFGKVYRRRRRGKTSKVFVFLSIQQLSSGFGLRTPRAVVVTAVAAPLLASPLLPLLLLTSRERKPALSTANQ